MTHRRGEKLGWTLGFLGGTAWMFIAAAGEFISRHWAMGSFTLAAGLCVVAFVILLAPWKHPSTPFWKLALPPVAAMILTASTLITRDARGFATPGDRFPFMGFIVMMVPFAVNGGRRWQDGETGKKLILAEPEL